MLAVQHFILPNPLLLAGNSIVDDHVAPSTVLVKLENIKSKLAHVVENWVINRLQQGFCLHITL